MKALIVLGGDAPGVGLLKACAAEADFSIAADRGLEAFDAAGMEPDMLIGDMDSVSPQVLARYESRLSADRLNCIKDDTDGEYALNLALEKGATEITLLGALGGRLDHALFAIGWRRVGVRFAVRSFISMLLLSLFIDLMPEFDLAGNMMLAAIFGGVTMGAGLGMVVRAGATTGGTDMAAMIVHAHLSMFTVPMVLFTIDGIVVVVAALNFGVQAGLFALIALFVSTKTMDSVIKGFNTAMQFLIISPNQEEIVRRIHTEMDRGCTRLEATGTYEGRKNGALLCVVPRMEASRLKKIVSECDAHAFVTVCDVHEALGEGFSYRHIS